MKRIFQLIFATIVAITLTGCGFGAIETGEVGVRTTFSGQIEPTEVGQGFYTTFLSRVDTYTTKETFVALDNMTPRAHDNLSLKDLDITVYYKAAPDRIADFAAGHAGMSAKFDKEGFLRPGHVLLENVARGVVYDEVSKFDSLTLHQNRQALEAAVLKGINDTLDKTDKSYFQVTRVIVRTVQTDPQVEDSIRKAVAKDKELEAAQKDVQVKQQMADANERLAKSLTPAYLQHEYIAALDKCASNQHCTMLVGGNATPLLNIQR